jgi:hypothetical protein
MGSFAQGALLQQLTSTATSAGTTTLTASSTTWQRFTGSTTETVVLPDATTMKVGRNFVIQNRSTGVITVNFNGATLAALVSPGCERDFNLYANGSAAGDWAISNQVDIDVPLGMYATKPTVDGNLNIRTNQLVNTDGSWTSTSPADDLINIYLGATIGFQTGSAGTAPTNGTVTTNGGAFTRPTITSGEYTRMVAVYQSATNSIDTLFSSGSVTQLGLTNPGTLYASLSGTPIGYIDLISEGTFNFKTAGSGAGLIENKGIYRFGSGAGGGAGGDTSFKFQTITDTNMTVKKGYLILNTGEELYASADFTIALATAITVDGNYYGYIDRYSLPAYTTVNGRKLIAVTGSNFTFLTTTPDSTDLNRYIPIGTVIRSGGSYASNQTLATRRHDVPIAAGSGQEYALPLTVVGDVGTALQIKAGHVLTSSSFSSTQYAANISYWNLTSTSTVTNGNTSLGYNFTNASGAFTGTGILGVASSCLTLTAASSQHLHSTHIYFDPDDNFDWCCGGWFKANSYAPAATRGLFGNYVTGSESFKLAMDTSGNLVLSAKTASGLADYATGIALSSGWYHIALKYTTASNTFKIYVNGLLGFTQTLPNNLSASGASRDFCLGAVKPTADYWDGLIDEFYFSNGYAFTEDEIWKTFAAKLTHSRSLGPDQQFWSISSLYGDTVRPYNDCIVDMDLNDLYFDLSELPATAQVAMKLEAKGAIGSAVASRGRSLSDTATNIDAAMPFTFGFPGMITALSLYVESPTTNQYEKHDEGSYFNVESVSPYRIISNGTTLASIVGGSTRCILVASVGGESLSVSTSSTWNTSIKTTTTLMVNNDEILADTTSSAWTITLPSSPRLGHRVRVVDHKSTWVINNLTIGRNGNKIGNLTSNLICNSNGAWVELIFDGVDDWKIISKNVWNKVVASSAVALFVNDRLFANAATSFVATLPASPSVNDEVQILDAKGTFGVGNYVTINPGASNLRGGANTFDCNQPNKHYRAIYVDSTYGWDILY